MTKISISSVDLNKKSLSLIKELAEECCNKGRAPLELIPHKCSDSRWMQLRASLLKTEFLKQNSNFGDTSLWEPVWYLGISLLNERVRLNHLYYFQHPDEAVKKILKKLPNLANLLITEKNSEYGLLPVSSTVPDLQRFKYDSFAIYLAPTRNGMFNESLPLAELLCKNSKEFSILIRPDPFRIIPIKEAWYYGEKEAVFGKPINKEWLANLKKVEIAQHDPDPRFRNIMGDTTQYIWKRISKTEVMFACEELPHFYNKEKIIDIVAPRFMHGIYNIEEDCFTHLDGALHIYRKSNYLIRLDKKLNSFYKEYTKAKIFRIDGLIDPDLAVTLLTHFYRWNNVAPEYFTHHNLGDGTS